MIGDRTQNRGLMPKPTSDHVKAGGRPMSVCTSIEWGSSSQGVRRAADFDIWFRWTGGEGIKPGNNFEVVNGHIEQREKKEAYVAGREHYERYRVKARLAKFFDSSRFPFNDQGLTIEIEDSAHGAERLRFVADEQESGINRSGVLQGLKIMKSLVTVKLHSYESRRGDPRASPNDRRGSLPAYLRHACCPPRHVNIH